MTELDPADDILKNAEMLANKGEYVGARDLFDRVLQSTDSSVMKGYALQNLGNIAYDLGDSEKAIDSFSRAESHFREGSLPLGIARCKFQLGRIEHDRTNFAQATGFYGSCFDILEETDAVLEQVILLNVFGLLFLHIGEKYASSDSLELARERINFSRLGSRLMAANSLHRAMLAYEQNDDGIASDFAQEAYDVYIATNDALGQIFSLRTLAVISKDQKHIHEAREIDLSLPKSSAALDFVEGHIFHSQEASARFEQYLIKMGIQNSRRLEIFFRTMM